MYTCKCHSANSVNIAAWRLFSTRLFKAVTSLRLNGEEKQLFSELYKFLETSIKRYTIVARENERELSRSHPASSISDAHFSGFCVKLDIFVFLQHDILTPCSASRNNSKSSVDMWSAELAYLNINDKYKLGQVICKSFFPDLPNNCYSNTFSTIARMLLKECLRQSS